MAIKSVVSSTQPTAILIPCGHVLTEDAIIQCLVRNKLCPIDNQPIRGYALLSDIQDLSDQSPTALSTVTSLKLATTPLSLPSIAFGAAKWAHFFGDVGIEPPLPKNIDQILGSPCPIFSGKKVKETHLLTLIPQTVNGKPLTLQSLGELVKTPKQGVASRYASLDLGSYTDAPAPTSHWTLMSRSKTPGSYGGFEDKDVCPLLPLITQNAQASYEAPNVLDITVCIFMEHVQSGKCLYGQERSLNDSNVYCVFTVCQEKYNLKDRLMVGNFDHLRGLSVCRSGFQSNYDWGIGAQRKFNS